MKTGTTYLQHLLDTHRKELAKAGYCFPGEAWRDQHRAVREVLGADMTDPRRAAECEGAWARITEEMLTHRGEASVLSMEFLSYADHEQAARVVASFPSGAVDIVLTVRDAATALPAQWQTACQNGKVVPLRAFIQGVGRVLRDGQEAAGRGPRLLRRTQDIARVLDVWTAAVGADHVHVVTVPPRGSDPRLLWDRFAGVLGLDPAVCPDVDVPANPSLGLASAELLRLLNGRLRGMNQYDYAVVVAGVLSSHILAARASRERAIALNARGRRLASAWNRRTRKAVLRHGVHVVGELKDLPGRPDLSDAPRALPRPTLDELLDAAATARAGLRAWIPELEAAAETIDPGTAPTRVPPTGGVQEDTGPHPWRDAPDPLSSALDEVAALVRTCVRLHRAATGASAAAHA